MRPVIDPAADERCPALEPDDTLIDSLDSDMKRNGMIERGRDMRESAERAASRMSRRGPSAGGVVRVPGADHDTAERIGGRRDSRSHHRNRRKKLHQNRDHDDGSQMSQPLPHCFSDRIRPGWP